MKMVKNINISTILSDLSFPLQKGVSDSDSLSAKQSVSPDRNTAGDKFNMGKKIKIKDTHTHIYKNMKQYPTDILLRIQKSFRCILCNYHH